MNEPITDMPLLEELNPERKLPFIPTKNHTKGAGEIAIEDIYIGPRQRTVTQADIRYINEELVPSIGQRGLIHPVVLWHNEELSRWELVAGWNRLQTFIILGHTHIPYCSKEQADKLELLRLELEENLRRNDMRWQDKVLSVSTVHKMESEEAARRCENWKMEATGHIIGASAATVSYILPVAEALLAKDKEIMSCGGYKEAYNLLLRRKEAEAIKLLHARAIAGQSTAPISVGAMPGALTKVSTPIRTSEAMSGLVEGFEFELSAPAGSVAPVSRPPMSQRIVPLSQMVINADCIEWMKACASASYELIYTDPPFAIDMDQLEDVKGIEIVKDSHQVDENLDLLRRFFKPAYRVLKDDSHLILWMDLIHFEKLIGWAREAGFTTQNWPLLWLKPQGEFKNAAAYKNWPKGIETMMVCHKGSSTLRNPRPTNYWVASMKGERSQQLNPFGKPFMISKEIIEACIVPGMKMLEPFGGGGSIARAAINLGIDVTVIEKDKEQFPLLVESIRSVYREIGGNSIEFT